MVVLGDGLPFDYFRQEGHKEELEKHLSGYAGKAMEVVIKNAQAGRNPEAVFPNLTRLISDNIQIEIEEEEEPEEETQSKVEEAPDRFAEYLEDLQYAKSFKEQFGTDSTEMNEETASTKFYFGVLRDFFGL